MAPLRDTEYRGTDTLFEVVEQSIKFIVSHISVAFEFDGSIQRKKRFA